MASWGDGLRGIVTPYTTRKDPIMYKRISKGKRTVSLSGGGAVVLRLVMVGLLLVTAIVPCGAVLKEKDLGETLRILRSELEKTHNEMGEHQRRLSAVSGMMRERLFETMRRANQDALMLYSQKQDFTFDMTDACHEATELYREFSKRRMPYDRIMKRMDAEIARYQYLMETLSNIPPSLKMQQDIKNGKAKAPKFVLDKNGKQRQLPFMLDEAGQALSLIHI